MDFLKSTLTKNTNKTTISVVLKKDLISSFICKEIKTSICFVQY